MSVLRVSARLCLILHVSHLENHPMSFLHLSHICPCNCLICNLISGKGKPVDYPAFIRGGKTQSVSEKEEINLIQT